MRVDTVASSEIAALHRIRDSEAAIIDKCRSVILLIDGKGEDAAMDAMRG
jgi:hypothetical protein